MFKDNNRNTRIAYEIYSKLTIKTLEQRQWRHSGVFIVNFEHFCTLFYCFRFHCLLWTGKWRLGKELLFFKFSCIQNVNEDMRCFYLFNVCIHSKHNKVSVNEILYLSHFSMLCIFVCWFEITKRECAKFSQIPNFRVPLFFF